VIAAKGESNDQPSVSPARKKTAPSMRNLSNAAAQRNRLRSFGVGHEYEAHDPALRQGASGLESLAPRRGMEKLSVSQLNSPSSTRT
jgi:hypothetical protein